jgi:hypothetical protein
VETTSPSVERSWLNSEWYTPAWNGVSRDVVGSAELVGESPSVEVQDTGAGNSFQSWSSHQANWGESYQCSTIILVLILLL